jgi:mutator protein MutT
MKQIDVAIGIVMRAGKILICQRRAGSPLCGYWEFPGGKHEPGETLEQTLHRELAEELAIQVCILEPLSKIEFDYGPAQVRLYPYLCDHLNGEAQPLASQALAWAAPSELPKYQFPPANFGLIADLMARFAR